LDFGGSLGISYFHSRDFLREVLEVAWSVIELPNFVAAGRKHLESEELRFYETVEDCVRYHTPNIILLSGVLQCLTDPWERLTNLLQTGIPYVFIDRTGVIESDRDRLTIQHVPEWIYRVDKPVWFLSETKLLSCLADADYKCLCDFAAIDNYTLSGAKISFKGFICRKNRNES
jgi:putative methyltransferase (TIGR04325 family)